VVKVFPKYFILFDSIFKRKWFLSFILKVFIANVQKYNCFMLTCILWSSWTCLFVLTVFSVFLGIFCIQYIHTSNMILNRSSEIRYSCFVSDLRGKPSVFHYYISCGFSRGISYGLRKFLSFSSF
jgi:hypothetical protein